MDYPSHLEETYYNEIEQERLYNAACLAEFNRIQGHALYQIGADLKTGMALYDDYMHHCPIAAERLKCLDAIEIETLRNELDADLKLRIFDKILIRGY